MDDAPQCVAPEGSGDGESAQGGVGAMWDDPDSEDIIPESPQMLADTAVRGFGPSDGGATSPLTKRFVEGSTSHHRPLRDVTNATLESDDVIAESMDEDESADDDAGGGALGIVGAAMDARRRRRREADGQEVTTVDDEVVIVHETMHADHDACTDDDDDSLEDDPLTRFAAAPIPTEDDPGPTMTKHDAKKKKLATGKRRRALSTRRRFIDDGGPSDDDSDADGDGSDADAFARDDRASLSEHSDASLERGPEAAPNKFPINLDSQPPDPGFEVEDGGLSEHSDGSQDRTAGVKGLNISKLRGEGYGKGKRRRGGPGGGGDESSKRAAVADILARRRRPLLDSLSSDDDDDDDEDEDDDGGAEGGAVQGWMRPPMDQEDDVRAEDARAFGDVVRGVPDRIPDRFQTDSRQIPDTHEGPGPRAAAVVPIASSRPVATYRRRPRQGRIDAFLTNQDAADAGERNTLMSRDLDASARDLDASAPSATRDGNDKPRTRSGPAPAPWRFPHTLDGDHAFAAADVTRETTVDEFLARTNADGERKIRVAAALFQAGVSGGRDGCVDGTTAVPTRGDWNEWRDAIRFYTDEGDYSGDDSAQTGIDRATRAFDAGGFWRALRRVIVDLRDDEDARDEADLAAAAAAIDGCCDVNPLQSVNPASCAGGESPGESPSVFCDRLLESDAAASARRCELGWELLFHAGRAWGAVCAVGSADVALGSDDAAGSDSWARDAWDLVTDLLAASPLPNPVLCHVSSNDTNESSVKISRSSARARLREWRVRTSARPRLGGSNSYSAQVSFDGGFDVRAYAAAVADRVRVLATEWPRVKEADSPVWELWRRLTGVGGVKPLGLRLTAAPRKRESVWPQMRCRDVDDESARVGIDRVTYTCACCDLAQPLAWTRTSDESGLESAGPGAGCLVSKNGAPYGQLDRGVAGDACAGALAALATHLSKAREPRSLKKDLGRALQSASLLLHKPAVEDTRLNEQAGGGVQILPETFRAAGGASLRLTPRAADLRHRAATHVVLFATCLDVGVVDQAGVVLRQLCAPLNHKNKSGGDRLPSVVVDPGSRAIVCRAIGCVAREWIARGPALAAGSIRGPTNDGHNADATQQMKHFERLAREGEAAINVLFAEAARCGEADTVEADEDEFKKGAVVAEASASAAAMHAALVSCGACQKGAAAAQARFNKPLYASTEKESNEESLSHDGWTSRLFAQRALASLLGRGLPLADICATQGAGERLCDALALWTLGAGCDVWGGGCGSLSAALFSHPASLELSEGAPSGPGAARVQRLQRTISSGGTYDGDSFVQRTLRGANGFDVFGAGNVPDGWMRSRPGGFVTREEADFRVSAGALVSRQLASYGEAAVGAVMACVAALPASARASYDSCQGAGEHESSKASSSGHRSNPPSGRSNSGMSDKCRTRGANVAAARSALASAAAGTVRWLAELIARLPAQDTVPGSNPARVERIPRLAGLAPHPCPMTAGTWGTVSTRVVSCNVLPPTVTSLGALVAASLRRDGGSRGTRRAVLAAVAGRFEKRFNRTTPGSDDDSHHARDFAAATVGYIEGILDDDDGGAIADLAHALVDVDASPTAARDFLGKELFPRFLSRELAGSSQRRCARVWLSSISLFNAMLLLAVDGGAEGAEGGAEVADTAVRVLMNETLPAPAAAMLDAVVSSCADGLNHQAAAAASALFEFMSRRLGEIAARDEVVPVEVIAPVHVHRAEKRMKNRSGVVPARAAAPAAAPAAAGYFPFPGAPSASNSYFPFPGAPTVHPNAVVHPTGEEEDDEEEEEEDEEAAAAVLNERARADANARRARAQSSKRARADALAAALAQPDASKLLHACVSAAVAAVCTSALAAPVTDADVHGGGGGAFRSMNVTERGREIARHRAVITRERRRCRAEVEACAVDLTRRRFGCGLRSAPAPPSGCFGSSSDASTDASIDASIFWGVTPTPVGSHRVHERWSQPRVRCQSVSSSAAEFLTRCLKVRTIVDGCAGALADNVCVLRSVVAMLSEPESVGMSAGFLPGLIDVLRGCGSTTERLPPRLNQSGDRSSSLRQNDRQNDQTSASVMNRGVGGRGGGRNGNGGAFRPFGGRGATRY